MFEFTTSKFLGDEFLQENKLYVLDFRIKVTQNVAIIHFFRPPDPESELISRKSTNKKILVVCTCVSLRLLHPTVEENMH